VTVLWKPPVLALAAALQTFLPLAATADPVADFYKGKTVSIIVGAAEGGGFDVYARAAARHLPRHLPGSPQIIVQNRPGAGTINAANYVYSVAAQDGTVIAAISGSAPLLQIMGESGPQFDSKKFQWLGSVASDTGAFYVWSTAKVKTFKDAFTTPAILGSHGPNVSEIYPALANNVLGTKFKIIQGYKSGPNVRLAMEGGEVEGQAQTWDSVKSTTPQWITEGKINVLAQIALKPDPELKKMGVPMIMDFVTREHVLPKYTVEEAQSYFKLMLTGDQLARPYAVGPGVPAERVEALRKAFMAMAADPEFIAEVNKMGRPVEPMSGQEMQAMISELAATPKNILDNAKELVKYQGEAK
jgi:tripartite-type tricarboxylate transporter receptor subunit TctC